MTDTTTDSTVYDNLVAGDLPIATESATVDASQTLARGAAVGKKLVGAGTVEVGTNTGNGTCTLFSIGDVTIPTVGDYVLTCTEAVTHGGVFKLVDPGGEVVATGLAMTASTGAATAFEVGGLVFTLTDGSTDFAAGDEFTLPVSAGNGRVVKCDKTATDGSQEIYGIALDAATTGSGETAVISIAVTGSFNSDTVTFVSGTAYTDVEADARKKGIFFKNGAY